MMFNIYNLDKNDIIFDIGCGSYSKYIHYENEVHYFDANNIHIENLRKQNSLNKKSYLNKYGLGNMNEKINYYPKNESFYNYYNDTNKILLNIKKGINYVRENNIKYIDFMKIDTNGYELNVLFGFEHFIKNIKIIEFKYGESYLYNNIKLIDIIKYLMDNGFYKFSYLTNIGPNLILNFNDHYKNYDIICINKSYKKI